MSVNLPPVYEPAAVEKKIYRFWLDGEFFKAPLKKGANVFSIVIPPPNVTGKLHMGHALNNAYSGCSGKMETHAGL